MGKIFYSDSLNELFKIMWVPSAPSLCMFSVFYNNFLLFTCMCVCLYVGMCICLWCPEMSEEGVGSSAAEFIGGCEQPNMGIGNQTWGPLEQQQLLSSLTRPTIRQSLILLHSSPEWFLAYPPPAHSCGVDSALFSLVVLTMALSTYFSHQCISLYTAQFKSIDSQHLTPGSNEEHLIQI